MASVALDLVDKDWLRRALDAAMCEQLWGKRGIFPGRYVIRWLQRPRADDMRQMLDDMGIDWPEFEPASYDGKTFDLSRSREHPWGKTPKPAAVQRIFWSEVERRVLAVAIDPHEFWK